MRFEMAAKLPILILAKTKQYKTKHKTKHKQKHFPREIFDKIGLIIKLH